MIARFLSIITISLVGMSTLAMQSPGKVITKVENQTEDTIIIMAMMNPLMYGAVKGAVYDYDSFVIPSWGNPELKDIFKPIPLSTNKMGKKNDEVIVLVGKKAPQFIDLSDVDQGANELIVDKDGTASIKKIA